MNTKIGKKKTGGRRYIQQLRHPSSVSRPNEKTYLEVTRKRKLFCNSQRIQFGKQGRIIGANRGSGGIHDIHEIRLARRRGGGRATR